MDGKKSSYEWGIVILLALLQGIPFLDRYAVLYLFPFIINEFKISYTQAGALNSIIAITVALAAWFLGGLSDRFGRKIVLLPATIFFSIMSWFSGLTYSFLQMFLARGVMGIGLGGVLPPSVASIAAESTPSRRGLNFGIHQALLPLISIGLGSFLVTQLTKIVSWRMVLFIVGIPGLILTIILYFYMREPKPPLMSQEGRGSGTRVEKPGFFEPLKYRNVIISSIVNSLAIGGVFVFMTFIMVYLTKEIHLSVSEGGIILSLWGVPGVIGCILIPLLSDRVGRKTVIIPSLFVVGLAFGSFILSGSNFFLLALSISIGGVIMGGIPPIVISALTTENVPPHMAATATGVPSSIGGIFGGALMPVLAGYCCDLYGLKAGLFFPLITLPIAGFVAFFYEETAPKIIGRVKKAEE